MHWSENLGVLYIAQGVATLAPWPTDRLNSLRKLN